MSLILDSKTVIAADLDGTIAESKLPISPEMAAVLVKWLETRRFAVISGGKYGQFTKQILSQLPRAAYLEHLFLFPTNGAACYAFQGGGWRAVYEDTLNEEEKRVILEALEKIQEIKALEPFLVPERLYGEQVEQRGGQITFSGLGQLAPLEIKQVWDPDQAKRKAITAELAPLLPNFTITIGGATSIDITRKGIDKAYAIEKMKTLLQADNDHIIFLGDALFEGGNDWPAMHEGITCVKVADPAEAMKKIFELTYQ